jgi:predicted permease
MIRPGRSIHSALAFDWRDAWRSLRATPVVTVVAVLSLALGIGANTTLFSILNSLVLKTLPVREPEQLVFLEGGSWTNPIWEQIRDRQQDLFDGAFAWGTGRLNLSTHGQTDFVNGAYVSGRFFQVLGVGGHRGRLFTEADDRRDGGPDGPVAVISYRLWQQRFVGSEDVVGRRLDIDGLSFAIVGVTPPGFTGVDVGRATDVYVPLGTDALVRGPESSLDNRLYWWLEVIARRKAGQTVDQANAALRGVQPQIREATRPAIPLRDYLGESFTLSPAAAGRSGLRIRYQQPLTILLVVVGAVLLIACANIANLLLARATARRRELVVRLALGASRARLASQLFIESLMLAGGGAALGLALAQAGSAMLVSQLSTATNRVFLDTSPDWRVLAFTAGVGLVTALLFGLAPALGVTRAAPIEALKEQGRSVSGDRRFGLRNALVVSQVALSLALVVAAALFVRTFTALTAVPLGFNPEPLMVVDLNVARAEAQPAGRLALVERLREAAAGVPGVKSASLSRVRPMSGQGWNGRVELEGSALTERQRMTWINAVTPGWFATYGMRVLEGRDIGTADRPGGLRVAVVNESFAAKFLGGRGGVGRQIRTGGPSRTIEYQVIGVVSDAIYRNPREGAMPTMFIPLAQMDGQHGEPTVLAVETLPGARVGLERRIAEALGRVDSRVALTFNWYRDLAGVPVAQERLVAILAASFGGLALLLAGLGLYGLTAYSVNRRRREIGVRMALGARPGSVLRLILAQVSWLVVTGIVAGAGLSWWASRYIGASLLFRVQPTDPALFWSAASALFVVGTLAAWLPARRAAHVDPTVVLREE